MNAIDELRMRQAAPKMLEALERLCEAANDSDDACYGTLSTNFVRSIASAAIAAATEGAAPAAPLRPFGIEFDPEDQQS